MNELQDFTDQLRRSFGEVLSEVVVDVGEGDFSKLLVYVTSPTFEDMDEGQQQRLVWGRVLQDLNPEDQGRIEFIYTQAPSEFVVPDIQWPSDWNAERIENEYREHEDQG